MKVCGLQIIRRHLGILDFVLICSTGCKGFISKLFDGTFNEMEHYLCKVFVSLRFLTVDGDVLANFQEEVSKQK